MRAIAATTVVTLAASAFAQPSATVNLTGVSVPSTGTNPPDVVRTSDPNTIDAASGYTYAFNPTVHTTGFLGVFLFPNPTPLGDVLNFFVPGQARVVTGAVRNPGAGVPVGAFRQLVGGTFSGFTINLTLILDIQADRTARAAIRNITKPSGLGLVVDSGSASVTVATLPAAVQSEWHFQGDLLSVKESGSAPSSGPSKIRYLDDPAFGAILGGPGQETQLPAPATPTGITQTQSAFGTASSFGLPLIAGEDDTVYRTSPTRNLADPGNRAKSRGLGLALWPNTHDFWPDQKIGHWTMVWDLYIPAAAWTVEYPLAILEDNYNNDSSADLFIRQVAGAASIGYDVQPAQYIAAPTIQPSRWMRLAFVSDGYRTGRGRFFVDGAYIGESNGDWVYNSCKSTDPHFGDISSTNLQGTPVDTGTWNSWGQFPSPWAYSPTQENSSPMASTICLFSDLQGRGESVYIANLMFADEAMTDAQIATLGPASARGILFPHPAPCGSADFDGDGDTGTDADIEAFFACLGGNCCPTCGTADFDQDGDTGTDADIEAFFRVLGGGNC